jgi:putative lumazine-binding protein
MTDGNEERAAADEEEIRSVIGQYQEAGRLGSRALYRQAFHPSATISFPSDPDEGLSSQSLDAFAEEVATMVEGGAEVEERARAMSIHLAGNVAAARVDFTLRLGVDLFEGTDFMTLARVGGRWVITHKLYEMHAVTGE